MDEKSVVKNILEEIGIPYTENEAVLKEKILELSSDAVIRLKNLLNFNQKKLSNNSFGKYSRFLSDVLRIKRFHHVNPQLLTCEDNFHSNILPEISISNKIVAGISIWGLYLNYKSKQTNKAKDCKYLFMLLLKIRKSILNNTFFKIKYQQSNIQIKRNKLKNILIRRHIRYNSILRNYWNKFKDYRKVNPSNLIIPQPPRQRVYCKRARKIINASLCIIFIYIS